MLKKLVFFVFAMMLAAPAIQMITGFPKLAFVVDENRVLAKSPEVVSFKNIHRVVVESVKWFNDHFGLRDALIITKTQIDYSIFRTSSKVYIGSKGWLFYRGVMDIEKPMIEKVLATDADAVVNGTQALAAKLAKRNIKLIIMIAPMKDVFYGRYLPSRATRLPDTRQVEQLQSRLRTLKDIYFLDATTILKEIAKKRAVFHKTDFHWNDPAAFEVAKIMVDHLSFAQGKSTSAWTQKLEVKEDTFSGGEASFLPLFYTPTEVGLFVNPNWEQPDLDYRENVPPYVWTTEIKKPKGHELRTLAVYGDSFFDGMVRSGISNNFKKIARANINQAGFDDFLANLPADTNYVMVEFIETDGRAYKNLSRQVAAE